ncbi:MAG: c-type cytochrome domain-containing protein [Gemmataceae bacterium]
MRRPVLLTALVFFTTQAGMAAAEQPLPREVKFNRDIRPILADKCYACHGPDKGTRKGDLRLDEEKDALGKREGYLIIAPGHP